MDPFNFMNIRKPVNFLNSFSNQLTNDKQLYYFDQNTLNDAVLSKNYVNH